ncbi:hypothetical protein Back11_49820 [Paenibacillus baekrokdamisoli]|uniref:Uncharacterized protein n=1 Tax=Paenibacillus baekrokdamisoli TaxID=1712516 RepID=A0A3G9IXL1_9BACL|nr:hypothetical protein Back11_49820 [Paenibacillus baekrokdamisoli]
MIHEFTLNEGLGLLDSAALLSGGPPTKSRIALHKQINANNEYNDDQYSN